MAGFIVIFQMLACLGFGMAALRLLGATATLTRCEQVTWGFALGFGLLGWSVFFLAVAGVILPGHLAALLAVGMVGLVAFRRAPTRPVAAGAPGWSGWDWLLLALLAGALISGLLQGVSPPADGDTLAYHFATPKQILQEGRLRFVPRAMDGAVPMLSQMTYLTALGLGGERALTLWTMASGWMATALLFSLCRRFLDRRWAMAVALAFMTVPAVVYGAGSGQVEVRNALFVMVAAMAVAQALGSGKLRFAALAGLAAGFFMAGKYLGLQFAFACGLVLLCQRRWFRHGAVFSLAALAAGSQWYVWNWLHTGDPIFPLLYGALPYTDPSIWDASHHKALAEMIRDAEQEVPASFGWLLAYPFVATFAGKPVFESGRTGFGPLVMLLLPFALAALWQFRSRLCRHPLFPVAAITVLFYSEWFLMASSQRLRHMLPVYPLLLLCVAVTAERWARASGNLRPLAGAVAITLALQAGGVAVYSANYARHLLSGESRNDFLARNVSTYVPIPWINSHLTGGDRVFTTLRWANYLLDVPIHYGHHVIDAQVDVRLDAQDSWTFYDQLRSVGVTHVLFAGSVPGAVSVAQNLVFTLRDAGCLRVDQTFDAWLVRSRTLDQAKVPVGVTLFSLDPLGCPTGQPRPADR